MKNKLFYFFVIAILALVGSYAAVAQEHPDIQYPISELANCANETECRAYCDDISHFQECIAFAEEHNLLSSQELAEAKRFKNFQGEAGPGGCTSGAACEAYCEDISHIDECLAFAEDHQVLSDLELDEARMVASALRQGAQLPGGCTSKAQCETYCEEPNHIEECLLFAEAAGFMSPEELEEARRVAPLMARGETPGQCRSREECEAYCAQEGNAEECATFFEAAGFITPEEAELFRKTGGRGPGGCQGEEECKAFCNDPANQEVCFEFAKEHGILEDHDIQNIEEGLGHIREGFENAPPEVRSCLSDHIGLERIERILSGDLLPSPEIGDAMRKCFEEHFGNDTRQEFKNNIGDIPSEAAECIQNIIGDGNERPTPEQERRIGEECFPRPEQGNFEGFSPSNGGFEDDFQGEFHEDFKRQFDDDFDQGFDEEFKKQFEDQFDEEFKRQFEEEFRRQIEQQGREGFDFQGDFQDQFSPSPEDFRDQIPPEFRDQPFVEPQEFRDASQSEFDGDHQGQPQQEPSEEEKRPEGRIPPQGFLGAVIEAMELGLRRILQF